MTLQQIVEIFGDGNFKLCEGKRAIDANLYTAEQAQNWLAVGCTTVGLWCPEGFVFVDIDDVEQAKILDKLTNTIKCRTPHGMHFYFRTSKQVRQAVKAHTPIGLRVDTRTAGKGYCLLPYNCNDREWISGSLEELPEWLVPLQLSNKAPEYIIPGAKSGDGRNDALTRQIMRLRKEGFSEEQIRHCIDLINDFVWGEPLSKEEIEGVFTHTSAYTPYKSSSDRLDFCLYNDKGSVCGINHKALVDHMIENYPMFTLGDTVYWYSDGVFAPNNLTIKDRIKVLIAEPKYQKQSQINEIFNLLKDDLRILVEDSACNPYKNFINFTNGMYSIDDQVLYPHDPRYMSTVQIPHKYEENDLAQDDIQLVDFLRRTAVPDDDIRMLLDYMAYSLTVLNNKKCFLCLVGGSNTGKSTLINMVNALTGKKNRSSLSIQDMSVRFYPAQLKDKLINTCADNSSLSLNDIGNLKKITGNDEIMYEDKGCKPYFFLPFAKLWFSFNTLPLQLEDKSDAFWERLRILEMNNKIVLNQTYVDDLCSPESISAIIPVLCKRLKGMKKVEPSRNSRMLSDKLRADSDTVHAFVASQIVKSLNYQDFIPKQEMYEMYSRFCAREDCAPYKRKNFYRSLEALGFVQMNNGDQQVYVGVKKFSK